jgi:hypothetical protein
VFVGGAIGAALTSVFCSLGGLPMLWVLMAQVGPGVLSTPLAAVVAWSGPIIGCLLGFCSVATLVARASRGRPGPG